MSHNSKKRKTKKRNSDYKPVFTSAEHKLTQDYGVGNLMDEVGVNRIMLVRTLEKMNEVRDQLTFRDHLDAMRAVSYTTGRIASLLEIREKLYQPYLEERKQYQEYRDEMWGIIEDYSVRILGQEKWDEMEWNALRQSMGLSPIEFRHEAKDDTEAGE